MSRAPEPNTQDMRTWRRLVRHATDCAADPSASAGDLAKAAKDARRCVAPGVLNRENPYVLLQRLAERYAHATDRQRREMAPELGAMARDCGGVAIAAPETPQPSEPPSRRLRADIDG